MSDAIWYYVDRAGQRNGPAGAAELVAAVHAGHVDDTSLVWRDGMPDWRPLGDVRADLGLAVAGATAPPPPPAAPAHAAAGRATPAAGRTAVGPDGLPSLGTPAKSNKGCLIAVLVVVGLCLLLVFGIIAAIAIPAYREYERLAAEAAAGVEDDVEAVDDASADPFGELDDFGHRELDPAAMAAVAGAVAEARALQAPVDAFVDNAARCPRDTSEIGAAAPANEHIMDLRVDVAGSRMCTIVITLGGPGLEAVAGEEITLSRDRAGDWYCTGALSEPGLLPDGCG